MDTADHLRAAEIHRGPSVAVDTGRVQRKRQVIRRLRLKDGDELDARWIVLHAEPTQAPLSGESRLVVWVAIWEEV